MGVHDRIRQHSFPYSGGFRKSLPSVAGFDALAATLALTLVFVVMSKPSYVANSTPLVLLSSEYSPRAVAKAFDDRALQENVMARKAANVRVIQQAETPVAPTNLRLMIFAAGALLSLFAGVLAAVLSNAFGRGYISPEAIDHGLGLPVLVAVPVLKKPPGPIAAQN